MSVCRKLRVPLGHLLKLPESEKIRRTLGIAFFGLDKAIHRKTSSSWDIEGETVTGWKEVVRHTFQIGPHSFASLALFHSSINRRWTLALSVFCHFPSNFCPDLMSLGRVVNIRLRLLQSCGVGMILWHVIPPLWGPESVQLLSWQDKDGEWQFEMFAETDILPDDCLPHAGQAIMAECRFLLPFPIFILQGLAMSGTPDTLAAKTLQSYICNRQFIKFWNTLSFVLSSNRVSFQPNLAGNGQPCRRGISQSEPANQNGFYEKPRQGEMRTG